MRQIFHPLDFDIFVIIKDTDKLWAICTNEYCEGGWPKVVWTIGL